MPVELHIRRDTPIPESEWAAHIEAAPRMGRQTGFQLGDILIPGTLAGPLRNGHVLPVFRWARGEITFNFRALGDDEVFQLVADICAGLDAFIEDDEGGQYTFSATDGLAAR